jgi:uncharacterized membrane protein YgcG
MRNGIDFSSWQALFSTLLGLAVFSLLVVGIRLLVMQVVQKRRERENRQINERLRPLIAACKTLGGSFTGSFVAAGRAAATAELVVTLRTFIRQVLDLEPIPSELVIPRQGPLRPSSGGSKGGGGRDERGGRGEAGRGGGAGRGGAGAAGVGGFGAGVGGLGHDIDPHPADSAS